MPLTNVDFRSFLREPGASNLSINRKKRKTAEDEERKLRRKTKYAQNQRRKTERNDDDINKEKAEYRDRAAERRVGKDDYYLQINRDMESIRSATLEESKYLGGDVEHTHLVKGLDYALLSKVRTELTRAPPPPLPKEEAKKIILSPLARRIWKVFFFDMHRSHISYEHRWNQIFRVIKSGCHFKGNTELFLPGRLSYQYDCRLDMHGDDVPVSIFKSKDDCPKLPEGYCFGQQDDTVEVVAQALARNHGTRKLKRNSARNHLTPVYPNLNCTPVKPVTKSSQDDIFHGVSSFNPVETYGDGALESVYTEKMQKWPEYQNLYGNLSKETVSKEKKSE